MSLRFPLIKCDDGPDHPDGPRCTICGEATGEPGEFINVSAGASFDTDLLDRHVAQDAHRRLEGVLRFWWHGAHGKPIRDPDGNLCVGDNPNVFMPVIDHVQGGQGHLLFCGIECLKRFFDEIIQTLQVQMAAERREFEQREREREDT